MKYFSKMGFGLIAVGLVFAGLAARPLWPEAQGLQGAWRWQENSRELVVSFVDDYCLVVAFDPVNRKFEYSWGGPCQVQGNQLEIGVQFHTSQKEEVGKGLRFTVKYKRNSLVLPLLSEGQEWQRIDQGEGALAGVWRFAGRKQGDKITETALADRRTLKVLTGTRFQWAAINIGTKEFFGTGGGTYTFDQGKYTEHIEFFSRDSSRVGATLQFEGQIQEGVWHHSGLNSRGEPLYEIWKRLKS